MRWLHGLLHDRNQVLAQLGQVHFMTKGSTESPHRFGRIILATVEAPIDDLLNTTAQGQEERGNNQRRDDNDHIIILLDDPTQEELQADNETGIDRRQQRGQHTVHQRFIDQDINIPQLGAYDGYAY